MMFGIGLTGLWAARHGTFGPAATDPRRAMGAGPVAGSPTAPSDGSGSDEPVAASATPADEDPDDFDQLFRRRRRKG